MVDDRHSDELDEAEIDEADIDDGERLARRPPPIRRFYASATGSALAAAMSGLGNVLEPTKREQPAVIVEYTEPGEPFTEPIVMRLDPDDPRDSIVLVRRHLLAHDDDPA